MRIPILMMVVCAPLCAAQTSDDNEPVSLEDMTVTGQDLSRQLATETKRAADQILDAVSADEIGQLPDKNAAEAVDRLPGVSITIDQGEGRFVSIRGITPTLNNLTINGVSAGSPEADSGGRLAPLDIIGGDLLKRIEVIKANTPDMDAQGIGGTINVVTASPSDYAESSFAVGSAQIGDQEFGGDMPYAADLTIGGNTDDRSFGWLAGFSYSDRTFISRGIFQDDWREEIVDGTTLSLPENAKNNWYELERLRTGLNGELEFRPNDQSEYFLRAFYSKFEEDEERQRYEHFFSRSLTSLSANGGISGDNGRREQDLRLEQKDKEFFNVSAGGKWLLGSQWELESVIQYNDNRQEEPNFNWEFRGDGYGPGGFSINDRGVVLNDPDPALLDPATLRFRRLRIQDNETDETATIVKADLTRSLSVGSNPASLKFGAKLTATERDNDAAQVRYNLGSTDWFASEFGHFGGNFTNRIDGIGLPNMRIDPAGARSFFESNRNNLEFFELAEGDTFEEEFQADYTVDEDVFAAYAMGTLDVDRWRLIAGLRFEATDIKSSGFRLDAESGTAVAVRGEGDYDNLLPALIARYEPNENWVIRASWTNTLGRPDYDQIAPISTLTRDGSNAALFIGNPNLEARESSNFDVSVEYYLNQGGLVSVAAFYKDIDNFIVSQTEAFSDFTLDGETFEQFDRTSLVNANSAEVSGLEFSLQQRFTALPGWWSGFGASLAFAALDSELEIPGRSEDLPLVGQPDWTRSVALTYQNDVLQAALSYDEADSFLTGIGGDATQDFFMEEYGRLDFKATYSFARNYAVFFEWQNINNEPTVVYVGDREDQLDQYEEYGETLYVGFNARF